MDKPKEKDKYFTKTTFGGLNNCILGNEKKRLWEGSVLPNCMGCAIGLFNQQIANTLGEGWYYSFLHTNPNKNLIKLAEQQGLEISMFPKKYSMLVWSGHIAFVDEVISNNKIKITESSYSGAYVWRTRTITNSNGRWGRENSFLGFVCNPYANYKRPTTHPNDLIVKKGDTWLSITEEFYGPKFIKRNAVELAAKNNRRILDELKVGERIRLI